MITKEKYLEALSIVEEYHKQLKNNVAQAFTPISQWEKFNQCSGRLKRVLFEIQKDTSFKQNFVEEIKLDTLRKMRNCGKRTVDEFINLRGY